MVSVMESVELYREIYVDGYTHKMATLVWDSNNVIRYAIGSFTSRMLLDNCLSLMQKGVSARCNGENLITSKKGYISKVARAKDENTCDGVHASIYSEDENVLRVFNDENEVDKVYNWLLLNTQSGLIEEWKGYLYNTLKDKGLINVCEGFDFTGMAPKVLVISDKVDTALIRNLKGNGLKSGDIKLPVSENQVLANDISFLEIIEDLILPNIEEENCHFNIGDEISPLLQTSIKSGDKITKLFPRQQIIAQGLLNAIKENKEYLVFNGGTGIGKTYTSIKLSNAVIKEVFKRESGVICIFCQGHLSKKWKRQVEECLHPEGIFPNITIVSKYTDINKIPKNPKGLEVIIMPKDIVKRTYLKGFVAEKSKYNKMNLGEINNFISSVEESNSPIIFKKCDIKDSEMKIAAIRLEKSHQKKVILYKPLLDNDANISSYKVVTTSKILKNICSNDKSKHRSYDFIVEDINYLKSLININHNQIVLETKARREKAKYYNPLVCPCCGGTIYDNDKDQFSLDNHKNYLVSKLNRNARSKKNNKCNSYIKADGTPLTELELRYIRLEKIAYKVVSDKVLVPYVDLEGNTLSEEELLLARKLMGEFTLLVRKCNAPLWGADDVRGYRCINTGKWLLKKWGPKSIDVSIYDECHLLQGDSNQGETFSHLCKASRINIPMTGTLTSGVSSDVFKLLFRLCPSALIKKGYGYNDEGLWIDHFGRKERKITEYKEAYNASGTKMTSTPWKEVPGISPMLFEQFLSNNMVARKIEDMNIKLPKLRYFKHEIEMSSELSSGYENLKDDMVRFMKENKDVKFGGYIHNLYSYVDNPVQDDIYAENGEYFVARPALIDIENKLLPKEKKLIDTIKKELSEGRRTLLYATYTGIKGVSKRLMEILSKEFNVAQLVTVGKGAVKLKDREDWIEKKYREGIEVILVHPEAVSTGLDIVQYPTIYFYEVPFNIKTLRQAEKRAYRPQQDKECRIYYSYYKGTIQEDAIKVCSAKKRSSLALEGVFSEDLLSVMSEGSESIEKILNKVLVGKYTLKEESIDDMFEEEVNFTFEDTEEGNVEVTKTFIGKQKVTISATHAEQLDLFSVDDEFMKTFTKKKKSNPIEGQLGFLM